MANFRRMIGTALFISLIIAIFDWLGMIQVHWPWSAAPFPTMPVNTLVTIEVFANGQWVDTRFYVTKGAVLEVKASGTWRDGDTTSGPDGASKSWPDNFFNLKEIGVCNTCAREFVPRWGALIGYIGNSPPAPMSYTSKNVLPEARKVFYIGSHFRGHPPFSGRLWLNKNADAYSGNTADNSGRVTATIILNP